jgi:hypothetical protein
MTLYTAILFALGTEAVYKPGVWEPSLLWIVLSFVAGLIAAFAGGWVCLRVSRDARAATWLMGLIVVLGLMAVVMQASAPPPADVRPAEVSPMDAASKSITPLWAGIAHIGVGITGVWLARRAAKV